MFIFICGLPTRLQGAKFLNPFSRSAKFLLVDWFGEQEHDVVFNTNISFEGETGVTILCTKAEPIFRGKEGQIGCELVSIMEDVCEEYRIPLPKSCRVIGYLN